MYDQIIFTILLMLNAIASYKNFKYKNYWIAWFNAICVLGCMYFIFRLS
jgi:hypothetical protein